MNFDSVENRDFIVLGIQNWDEKLGSNPRNISYQLAKKNRVLYVDMPVARITAMREAGDPKIQKQLSVVKGKEDDLMQVDDNIWLFRPKIMIESVNWIPNNFLFDVLNKRNNKLYAKEIQNAMDRMGFKDVIMFYDNDLIRGFYLKDFLKIDMFVYYIRDFLIAIDYWKKHGARLEPDLIAKADVIVANSEYYADYCKKFNNNSHFIGQGCNVEQFNPDQIELVPEDIVAIKKKEPNKPIIGYVGVIINVRLNEQIMLHIAKERPDWNLVLIGPEDEHFQKSELHNLSNVHFLGFQDISKVPGYISQFDVCINPQALNPVTVGNYPLKIDEYLAMKKPVVATHTRAMDFFADHCYLAKNKEEYISKIEEALKLHTDAKADAGADFAKSHTWENNVKAIYKAINHTIELRKKETVTA